MYSIVLLNYIQSCPRSFECCHPKKTHHCAGVDFLVNERRVTLQAFPNISIRCYLMNKTKRIFSYDRFALPCFARQLNFGDQNQDS
jgi:hypothetical protein